MKMMAAIVTMLVISMTHLALGQERTVAAAAATFQKQLTKARMGDSRAQNEVGIMYAEGRGTERNVPEGMRWFERSAEQGNARAACNLGLHFAKGLSVTKDVVEAVKWFYIGSALDPLSCFVSEDDVVPLFGRALTIQQLDRGFRLAVDWLKARPALRNNVGEQPWLDADASNGPK